MHSIYGFVPLNHICVIQSHVSAGQKKKEIDSVDRNEIRIFFSISFP